MRRAVALAGALFLGGCAHGITLTPQDGLGPIGTGSAEATLVNPKGKMTVLLAGKTYEGFYVFESAGGAVGSTVAVSGGQVASGTFFGASTQGGGQAYLTANDGVTLSCQYGYSQMSMSGTGLCRRSDDGKMYNLLIH